jgi:hypothetical protein
METERAPKLLGSKIIRQTCSNSADLIQRLSSKDKGVFFIYHLEQVKEMGGGLQLVPYLITCYFIGHVNLWSKVTLLWSPGNIPQIQFFFVSLYHSLSPFPLPALLPQ